MSDPKTQAVQALKDSVRLLIRREIANSWKGGGHPADIPSIEADLRSAKAAFGQRLHALQVLIPDSQR